MPGPLLAVDNLRTVFRTRRGEVRAVDRVSFEIGTGETVGIVGESGCGKSMIALSIMRLVRPPGIIEGGSVRFEGVDLLTLNDRDMRRIRGKRISMIFQEPMMSLNPVLSCGCQIREVFMHHRGLSRRRAQRKTVEMLEMVGIPAPAERARNYPHQLSGGMQQRIMIAMALASHPAMLIADEPTTALDVTIQAQILDLLVDMKERFRMSCLIITHDFSVVADVADRILVVYAGQIIEEAGSDDLLLNPLHPYTRGLLSSLPPADGGSQRLTTIEGSVPDPFSLPDGCRFHPRCRHSLPVCRTLKPDLKTYEQTHRVRCWVFR